jgi:hypothetical protein
MDIFYLLFKFGFVTTYNKIIFVNIISIKNVWFIFLGCGMLIKIINNCGFVIQING